MASIKHSKKAFTLIELLVTISIIGILAGIVSVNVGSSQARGRDAKRKSDISAIKTAIEMYRDGNGGNPISGTFGQININPSFAELSSYLLPIPTDPKTGWDYYYGRGYELSPTGDSIGSSLDTSKFVVCSKLENENDSDYKINISNPDSLSGLQLNYCVSGI